MINILILIFLTTGSLSFSDAADHDSDSDIVFSVAGSEIELDGSATGMYSFRTTYNDDDRENDHDLYEVLRLDFTMPQRDLFELHLLGNFREDLNGGGDRLRFYPFEDIGDTYVSNAFSYNIYEAHFDINYLWPFLAQVRLGRQTGVGENGVSFDGAAIELEPHRRLSLSIYGGLAVHLHEVGYTWGSDVLGGLDVIYSPFDTTRLGGNFLYVLDKREPASISDQRNHSISLYVWQRFFSFLNTMAKFSLVNFTPRNFHLKAGSVFTGIDLELGLQYFLLFNAQNELSNEFSIYYDVLGPTHPHQSFSISARKLIGEGFAVGTNFFLTLLLEDVNASPFNLDHSRINAFVDLFDLFTEGLSFEVIGEYSWSSRMALFTAGLDAEYTFNGLSDKSGLNAGVFFNVYQYNYNEEPTEVRFVQTYYLNGTWVIGKRYSINGGYEFESSFEPYHSMKLGMRIDL